MADRNTEVALDRFTWRMLSQYVAPWDFERLEKTIRTWDQWCAEWSKEARRYSAMADKALAEGNRVTAGDSTYALHCTITGRRFCSCMTRSNSSAGWKR